METSQAVAALAALAQPSRLTIFRMLVQAGPEGAPSGEIARALEAPANTTSANLAVLARAGLIRSRRESRFIRYSADFDRMGELLAYLVEDCCAGCPEICHALAAGPVGELRACGGASA